MGSRYAKDVEKLDRLNKENCLCQTGPRCFYKARVIFVLESGTLLKQCAKHARALAKTGLANDKIVGVKSLDGIDIKKEEVIKDE